MTNDPIPVDDMIPLTPVPLKPSAMRMPPPAEPKAPEPAKAEVPPKPEPRRSPSSKRKLSSRIAEATGLRPTRKQALALGAAALSLGTGLYAMKLVAPPSSTPEEPETVQVQTPAPPPLLTTPEAVATLPAPVVVASEKGVKVPEPAAFRIDPGSPPEPLVLTPVVKPEAATPAEKPPVRMPVITVEPEPSPPIATLPEPTSGTSPLPGMVTPVSASDPPTLPKLPSPPAVLEKLPTFEPVKPAVSEAPPALPKPPEPTMKLPELAPPGGVVPPPSIAPPPSLELPALPMGVAPPPGLEVPTIAPPAIGPAPSMVPPPPAPVEFTPPASFAPPAISPMETVPTPPPGLPPVIEPVVKPLPTPPMTDSVPGLPIESVIPGAAPPMPSISAPPEITPVPVRSIPEPAAVPPPSPGGITFTKPAGASDVRPVSSTVPERPVRTDYDVGLHEPRAGETYESISEEWYNSKKLAAALRAFNRNKPLQGQGPVEVPPIDVLRKTYPQFVSGDSRTSAVPSATTEWTTPGTTAPRPEPAFRSVGSKEFVIPAGGMTMREASRAALGLESRWSEVYELNPEITNPGAVLPAGTKLRLP